MLAEAESFVHDQHAGAAPGLRLVIGKKAAAGQRAVAVFDIDSLHRLLSPLRFQIVLRPKRDNVPTELTGIRPNWRAVVQLAMLAGKHRGPNVKMRGPTPFTQTEWHVHCGWLPLFGFGRDPFDEGGCHYFHFTMLLVSVCSLYKFDYFIFFGLIHKKEVGRILK